MGFTWTNIQSADTDQRHCGWVNVLHARLYKEQDSLVNLTEGNKIGHCVEIFQTTQSTSQWKLTNICTDAELSSLTVCMTRIVAVVANKAKIKY